MQWDLRAPETARDAYRILTSAVMPRPIALCTTVGTNGVVNAAPFSFFNLLGSDPPVVGVSVARRGDGSPKDTAAHALATGEFVVNLVDWALKDAMNVCAIEFPPGVSEVEQAKLTLAPSVVVRTPRLAQSPVNLECRLLHLLTVGGNRILIGEIVYLHIADDRLDSPTRVSAERLDLIGRMGGGGGYARTASDLFEMPRIPLADWDAK